jgi:hypothetical protein
MTQIRFFIKDNFNFGLLTHFNIKILILYLYKNIYLIIYYSISLEKFIFDFIDLIYSKPSGVKLDFFFINKAIFLKHV